MLIPNGSRVLETPRLLLRPFVETDGEAMYRNWTSDPEVARYVTWNVHQSPDESRALCRAWAEEAKDPLKFRWAMVLKETGEPVGSIDVVSLSEERAEGEIGYVSSRSGWGKGLMTEAYKAVMAYLFSQCGFEALLARHDIRNPASGRVMEKCGMSYTHDEEFRGKNDYVGIVSCYRITKSQWQALQP